MAKKSKLQKQGTEDRNVRDESLTKFGRRNIKIYATEVNLARSVPDLFDGLKPVQRRILWGASVQNSDVKTARIVGDVLGKYHPHGDVAVQDAIETLITSAPTALMYGKGNWGGLMDGAAAMRYTNCGLTGYGRTLFDNDYINGAVTQFVPNYDGRDTEPVTLPAMLPHVLMTASEGIGVGITTCLPSFTPKSVVEMLELLLKGKKVTRETFAETLKPSMRWGGRRVKSKANKEEWMKLFTDSEANVQFEADIDVDRDHKAMVIREWPAGLRPDTFIEKVRELSLCKAAYNIENDVTVRIECRKDANYDQFDKFVEKVQKMTRKGRAFKVNVTQRQAIIEDGRVSYKTEMIAAPVPEIMLMWLRSRVAMETVSLKERIRKQEAAIHYSKLLLFAADKLDIIFKGLRQKDTETYLVKHLKKSIEDVKTILELKVRQLSSLDASKWEAKLKEQEKHLKQLNTWLKEPKTKVLLDVHRVHEIIQKDVEDAKKRATVKLKAIKAKG